MLLLLLSLIVSSLLQPSSVSLFECVQFKKCVEACQTSWSHSSRKDAQANWKSRSPPPCPKQKNKKRKKEREGCKKWGLITRFGKLKLFLWKCSRQGILNPVNPGWTGMNCLLSWIVFFMLIVCCSGVWGVVRVQWHEWGWRVFCGDPEDGCEEEGEGCPHGICYGPAVLSRFKVSGGWKTDRFGLKNEVMKGARV